MEDSSQSQSQSLDWLGVAIFLILLVVVSRVWHWINTRKQKAENETILKRPDERMLDALKKRDIKVVKRLVESGFDLSPVPGYGTYLNYAWGYYGEYDFEIVKYLIEAGGVDLNDASFPAIVTASGRGKLEELQYILDRGADINAITHVKTSALWQAAYHNQLEEIEFLLKAGLDIKLHGVTALQVAARIEFPCWR